MLTAAILVRNFYPYPWKSRFKQPMRYFVQFVIPALIFVSLIYLVGRHRGQVERESPGPVVSNSTFVLCLVVGATFTVALLFGLAEL